MAKPHRKVGHQARKRFGQNFLHDEAVIDQIISGINPRPGDRIVEIGPGLGTVTQYLADAGAKVIAIEKDDNLIPYLKNKFASHANVQIVHHDKRLGRERSTPQSLLQARVFQALLSMPWALSAHPQVQKKELPLLRY